MSQAAVAVLGTLAEFHADPLTYDLAALVDLVATINPDLLCLDMSLSEWEQQDFSRLSPEYAAALLPLAAQTDMVVVPIGGATPMPRAKADGWRGRVIDGLRWLLRQLQASAPEPEAHNQGWRHDLGNWLYQAARMVAGSEATQAYHQHIDQVVAATLRAVENNPDNRILVVTNIQYCHHIRPRLRQAPTVNEQPYQAL